MTHAFGGRTAITGIGATAFLKVSGRSNTSMACEAIVKAIADAGLDRDEIDGMVTYSMDDGLETDIARSIGLDDLTFIARSQYGGGGAAATMQLAAMAVSSGVARNVVVYRSLAMSTVGIRERQLALQHKLTDGWDIASGWSQTYGLTTPASCVAMHATRYMYESGATSADFGVVSVLDRKHTATNPAAYFYGRPITIEDHQASRFIVEPIRLLDCCLTSDGAVAYVVSSVERARDLQQPPAVVVAAVQGSPRDQEPMTSYYRPEFGRLPEVALVARQLWETSGLEPADMDVASLYDHFTPFVLIQLEELGFCDKGDARHFIADGNLEIGGALPINTNGGHLGEAYIHGINGILEVVRQIRGTSYNQVSDVEHALVTAGTGVPTSAAILRVDR